MLTCLALQNRLIELKGSKARHDLFEDRFGAWLVFVNRAIGTDLRHRLDELRHRLIVRLVGDQRQQSGDARLLRQRIDKVGVGNEDLIDFAAQERIDRQPDDGRKLGEAEFGRVVEVGDDILTSANERVTSFTPYRHIASWHVQPLLKTCLLYT